MNSGNITRWLNLIGKRRREVEGKNERFRLVSWPAESEGNSQWGRVRQVEAASIHNGYRYPARWRCGFSFIFVVNYE